MTISEQRLCEYQAELFERSKETCPCGSAYFVFRFMKSSLAKELDRFEEGGQYPSLEDALSELETSYPSLKAKKGTSYPRPVLRWMGYIYRALALRFRPDSGYLYERLEAERMLSLYDSFHTFDPDYCIDRLIELIQEEKPGEQDAYQVFYQIKKKRFQF